MGGKSKRMHYGPGEGQLATPNEIETTLLTEDLGHTARLRRDNRKQKRRRAGKAQRLARRRNR